MQSMTANARAPIQRALYRKLWSMSAGPDLLHDLLGFGHFDEMAMTRDGLLIARLRGCDGFDVFIGHPTEAMCLRTGRLWQELTEQERLWVLRRLKDQGIPPQRVGLPEQTHD